MLASPLPTKRPNSSSSIAFVPRQIMLDSSSAVVAKERRKEKKKRSSETLHLDRAEDGGASHQEQGRDALLRSIAAFLDVNGFSKTLSVFQSETQLEIGCWKSSFVNLEDLFCKFFDSSNGHAEVSIDWLKDLDLQKVSISGEVEEKIHKKKRKRTNQIDDGIETEDNKTGREKGFGEGDNNGEKLSLDGFQDKCKEKKAVGWGSEGLSADKSLNENSDLKKLKSADDLHTETKEKKRKKKLVHDSTTEGAEDKHLEVSRETAESIGPANQYKEEKKKHKMMAELHDEIAEFDDSGKLKEMVKVKTEELVSLTNNSFESNVKHKSEKKKDKKLKQVELEASENTSNKKDKDTKLVGAEGRTGSASKNALDDNDSQAKVRKQKQKSSKILSTVSSDQAGEGRSSDQLKECDINQDADAFDSGHGVPVSEDMNIKLAKKTSKKRALLDSGGKADNEIASKESKVTSEGAENNEETRNLLKSDKSTLDSDTPVVTKKRKMEESKETTKNAGEQLELSTKSKEHGSASNSKNELVAHQLANGSIGNNGGKEKPSAEPKSVNPFQRVKMDEVKFVDERLKDNSYWAKDGADTGYGAKAQEVLGQVRGRDFRHEKTKKKRGSYRGGQITLQSHSIKFSYSDDDE